MNTRFRNARRPSSQPNRWRQKTRRKKKRSPPPGIIEEEDGSYGPDPRSFLYSDDEDNGDEEEDDDNNDDKEREEGNQDSGSITRSEDDDFPQSSQVRAEAAAADKRRGAQGYAKPSRKVNNKAYKYSKWSWSTPRTLQFIKIALELKNERFSFEGKASMKKKTFAELADRLEQTFPRVIPPGISQLSNKWKAERERYIQWAAITGYSGVSLDPVTYLVHASDEQWENFLAVERKGAWLQRLALSPTGQHELWADLFEGAKTTGSHCRDPHQDNTGDEDDGDDGDDGDDEDVDDLDRAIGQKRRKRAQQTIRKRARFDPDANKTLPDDDDDASDIPNRRSPSRMLRKSKGISAAQGNAVLGSSIHYGLKALSEPKKEGDISISQAVADLNKVFNIAKEQGEDISYLQLANAMEYVSKGSNAAIWAGLGDSLDMKLVFLRKWGLQ